VKVTQTTKAANARRPLPYCGQQATTTNTVIKEGNGWKVIDATLNKVEYYN